ncbi:MULTISPECIES: hypothetical protein [unclassified Streptomyces]|uniref:hypothetical protein n=1 Tax=unclassified Streptomyces TaxID=2593676 RepID=UPI000381929A|nr:MULTISPECIES: hypothetical protein [unclassified Streptomyces]MYT33309.1 hypothetical protein [Streptomyces sp. SID8354]
MPELKQSKSEWTSNDWYKVCGEFTFRPRLRYQMMNKKDHSGRPIWGVEVPDLNSARWEPEFEFAYDIWTSNGVSGAALTQRGQHSVWLFATIYSEYQWSGGGRYETARVAKIGTKRCCKPSHRETISADRRIECDSGKYYVEWSISRLADDGTADRQGDGGPQGVIEWDSDAAQIKREIAINQNIYG